jgi:hypothetical protein
MDLVGRWPTQIADHFIDKLKSVAGRISVVHERNILGDLLTDTPEIHFVSVNFEYVQWLRK